MSSTVHLLVLIHGMWGNPTHLSEMSRVIRDTHDRERPNIESSQSDFHVIVAQTNSEEFTYDGIDHGAERVTEELLQEVEKLRNDGLLVTRISICGYSLGGLIARYLVGILYHRGFFENITPVNFYTIATPHLGIPSYPSFISKVIFFIGPKSLSRTGEQFFLRDEWGTSSRPLLAVMADKDSVFYKGLCLFPRITIYANAIQDHTVPYLTGAIELEDPYLAHRTNGARVELHEKYPHLLVNYVLPEEAPPLPPKATLFSPQWFREHRPPLPPALQVRFPFDILVMIFLPVILSALVGLGLLRLTSGSRSSRDRIRSLEAQESHKNSLAHILAEMEKKMQHKIVNLIEDDAVARTLKGADTESDTRLDNTKPTLTEPQKEIARLLNTLPNLKKEITFFPTVSNAHPVIICRSVETVKAHGVGRDILQHWADNFVF